jgi:hypothetical protein
VDDLIGTGIYQEIMKKLGEYSNFTIKNYGNLDKTKKIEDVFDSIILLLYENSEEKILNKIKFGKNIKRKITKTFDSNQHHKFQKYFNKEEYLRIFLSFLEAKLEEVSKC